MKTPLNHQNNTDTELNQLICEALTSGDMPTSNRQNLRSRLLSRAAKSHLAESGTITVRARDGAWRNVKSGVRVKTLWNGPNSNSVLIELQAGAALPTHRHSSLEEGIVLSGGFQIDGMELGPGDYHMSPEGSRHGRITSRQGVVAYLRGTALGHTAAMLGELVGALLPGSGAPAVTVTTHDGTWEILADGVESKTLCHDGEAVSKFIRLQPGASLPPNLIAGNKECMMIDGDAFFGDLLVCAGDFHLTPANANQSAIESDHGALIFIRSNPAAGNG